MRSTIRVLLAFSLGWLAVLGNVGVGRTSAQTVAATPVEVTGSGSWTVNQFMTALSGPLYGADTPVALNYLAKGSRDGRKAFARGELDFVVAGRPFTADEQADLDKNKIDVVDAPFSVGAIAFLMSLPYPNGLRTVVFDDPTDPEAGVTLTPFAGPIKIPNRLMGKIFLGLGNNWNDPTFQADTFGSLTIAPVIDPVDPVVRSDPGTTNYALERFIKQFAPDEWNTALQANFLPVDTLSESWPFLNTPSRAGAAATSGLVGGWQSARGSGIASGGAIAAVPPSEALAQIAAQPAKALNDPPTAPTPLRVVEIQNGAGEYVAPTPDTITAAAAAGNGADLYGMTESVPGAYPLTWLNHLYAPSAGLSPEVATAIATIIRFSATTGQGLQRALGEGAMPAPQAAKALTAADALIAGNCKAAKGTVSTAKDGGPNWPAGEPLPSGYSSGFTVCKETAATATTTTVARTVGPAVSPTSVASSSVSSSGGSASVVVGSRSSDLYTPTGVGGSPAVDGAADLGAVVDSASLTNGDTAAAAGAAADGPASGNAVVASATLPLREPDDGRYQLDRLTTLLMGAASFLLLRGPAARLMARRA